MTIETIAGDDSYYFDWLGRRPSGYVANTPRSFDSGYYTIHHATCPYINLNRSYEHGAFTERQYIKIVSDDLRSLLHHTEKEGFVGCKPCSRCKPEFNRDDRSEVNRTDSFQREVAYSFALSQKRRRERLAAAPQSPGQRLTVIREFVRNPDVVAEALFLARGKCQSCGNQAPFLRTSNRSPYLEVHHRLPLAEGGLDTVENAIALCPNCHRREHFGEAMHRPQSS